MAENAKRKCALFSATSQPNRISPTSPATIIAAKRATTSAQQQILPLMPLSDNRHDHLTKERQVEHHKCICERLHLCKRSIIKAEKEITATLLNVTNTYKCKGVKEFNKINRK
ncbi:unnamed protein product [Ceratitis capitata]|uniref:(Mediterranean fruit fly) hypothetical protein n=1 Tax=Ceratitis capitata TaxID=7213 RepID=A0A811UXM9_CERCA|nr:unnamed protein product [Ceratitis capitata]